MATVLNFKPVRTSDDGRNMVATSWELLLSNTGGASTTLGWDVTQGQTFVENNTGSHPGVYGFYSERFAAQTALTGNITFSHYASATAGMNATFRLRLYRVLFGGTQEERLIGDFDGPVIDASNSVNKSWVFALPANVVVEKEERLLARIFVVPADGTVLNTGSVSVIYGNASTAMFMMKVTFDTTFTVLPNIATLHFRSTTTAAIGVFRDLLTASGASAATAVVNTQSGTGLEIQWTLTAGGTLAEWISGRLPRNFQLPPNPSATQPAVETTVAAFESATTANAGFRLKLFRYSAGVETVFFMGSTAELPTSAQTQILSSLTSTYTPLAFAEDDRIVARAYAISVGTMASGRTCTINYNGSSGQAFIRIMDLPALKAEGDAAASWTVPDGQSTLGLGN